MSTQEADLDLDFTRFFAARPPAPPWQEVAAPAVPVAPTAPAVAAAPGKAANLVCYARADASREAAASDAPVLVVEDHEPSRRMLEKMLQMKGYPVRSAADSREFAAEMRKPPRPRLILLDVGLPRVNGFDLLGYMRQHPQTQTIPVVMVTARTDRKDVMRGLALGADGYLSKPVSVAALQSVIETVLWKQ